MNQLHMSQYKLHKILGSLVVYVEVTLSDNSAAYLLPLTYTGSDGCVYVFHAHGNFNAVYFPVDVGQAPCVFKVPFSANELTDTPLRTVSLWNELYRQLFPNRPELATARIEGEGVFIPFIDAERTANIHETMSLMLTIFIKTKRVFLDALVKNNVVLGKDGERYPLDVGNIIKFSGNNDLEKSEISLTVTSEMLAKYLPFLNKLSQSQSHSYVSIFTRALLVLATLNLPLKNPENLLENDYAHWSFIASLAVFTVKSNLINPDFPKTDLFEETAFQNFQIKNTMLLDLHSQFHLTSKEIILLRLNPLVELNEGVSSYQKPLTFLSYFNISYREDIISSYILLNERFFHIAAFVLLGPNHEKINNFSNFTYYFDAFKNDPLVSHRYFLALKQLSEVISVLRKCPRFFEKEHCAFDMLKGLSKNHAEFLANGFAFGLRRKHLEAVPSDQKSRQDKIISILSHPQPIARDLDTLLSASEKQLEAMIPVFIVAEAEKEKLPRSRHHTRASLPRMFAQLNVSPEVPLKKRRLELEEEKTQALKPR